jgi:hypothetical protein
VQDLPNVAGDKFLTVAEPGGEPKLGATRNGRQVQLTVTGKQGSRDSIGVSTSLSTWTSAFRSQARIQRGR